MNRKQVTSAWVFIFFIILAFYSLGAGLIESFVNYPLWYLLGTTDVWTRYHQGLSAWIIPLLAFPTLLFQLIVNVLLIFFRPAAVSRASVYFSLVLLLVVIISSLVIQIPIQFQLSQGYSRELVDRLIVTDLWMRIAVGIVRCVVVIVMMKRVLINPLLKSKF